MPEKKMPWFNQNAYEKIEYDDNEYPLPPMGCGICAAAAALYWLFGNIIEPKELRNLLQWRVSQGQGEIFLDDTGLLYKPFLDLLSKSFPVEWEQVPTYESAREAIHDGQVLLTGNGGPVFLTRDGKLHSHGGHVVCMYLHGEDEQGDLYLAMDPQICGGADVVYREEDFKRWMESVEKRIGQDAGSCYALKLKC